MSWTLLWAKSRGDPRPRGDLCWVLLARTIILQLMYFADFDGMCAVSQEHFACGLHVLANVGLQINQLEAIRLVPLQLPNPSDPRALRVAKSILDDPSNRQTLPGPALCIGTSKRTVERLFHEDVGMTFSKWRQQLRPMQAMRLLADGANVT